MKPIENTNVFYRNQEVSLELSDGVLTVTSEQDFSTPGIMYYKPIVLKAGKFYEFAVKGSTAADVFLWVARNDTSTKERIVATTEENTIYMEDTASSISTYFGGFKTDVTVKIGILFEDPSDGDTFALESLVVIERPSQQVGNFMLADTGNSLVSYGRTDGEWTFIQSVNKA